MALRGSITGRVSEDMTEEQAQPPIEQATTPQPDAPVRRAGAKLDRWNKWLTLGANIGVVLGLIMLFIEVRQSAELTRTQMEQRKNDFLAEIEFSLAQPEIAAIWVKSIRTPEALSDAEIKTVESHLVALMLQWDHLFQMERSGLVTRDHVRQHIQNSAPYYFGSRFAKNWWGLALDSWGGTLMEEVAGPIVNAIDENFLAGVLDKQRIAPPPPAPAPEPSQP